MKKLFYLFSLLILPFTATLAQTITTAVGTGIIGNSPDGTQATSALVGGVHSVAVDRQGFLYFIDLTNFKIRKVTAAGTLTTVAGGGGSTADGVPATSTSLNPFGLDIDDQGLIYIADATTARIRLVTPSGSITTVAGGGGSTAEGVPATTANLVNLHGVAVHPQGGFFSMQTDPNLIRRITPAGNITTVAGTGTGGFSGDNGQATSAQINYPHDVIADQNGNFYIAEQQTNHRIRKVDAAGIITTVAGSSLGAGFNGDGLQATDAQLLNPSGLALDGAGNLYIADAGNNRVRKIDFSTGIITTVVGNGSNGATGDEGSPTAAAVGFPYDVAIDRQGNLYVAQLTGNRIRKVVGVAAPFLPTITLGAPAPICASSLTFNIPFTNTTDDPTSYTVTGTGVAANQTGPLSGTAGSITVAITPAFTGSFTVIVSGNTGTSLPVSGSVVVNAGATTPVLSTLTSSGTLGNGTCSVRISGTATGNSFIFTGPNGYVFSNVYRQAGTYPIFAQDVKQPGVYTLSAIYTDGCGNSATASQQITIGGTACN